EQRERKFGAPGAEQSGDPERLAMAQIKGYVLELAGPGKLADRKQDRVLRYVAYLSEDRLSLGLNQPQSIDDNLVMASLNRI
ncbi:sugar ABC transporter ATP-binding protein, partial [Rhizobium ruizarguesonis]